MKLECDHSHDDDEPECLELAYMEEADVDERTYDQHQKQQTGNEAGEVCNQ